MPHDPEKRWPHGWWILPGILVGVLVFALILKVIL